MTLIYLLLYVVPMGLVRNTKDALRKSRARENKTSNEIKRRLDAARANKQRETYLLKLWFRLLDTHSLTISEFEKQTSQRLLPIREHARLVRANETKEQTSQRLLTFVNMLVRREIMKPNIRQYDYSEFIDIFNH